MENWAKEKTLQTPGLGIARAGNGWDTVYLGPVGTAMDRCRMQNNAKHVFAIFCLGEMVLKCFESCAVWRQATLCCKQM